MIRSRSDTMSLPIQDQCPEVNSEVSAVVEESHGYPAETPSSDTDFQPLSSVIGTKPVPEQLLFDSLADLVSSEGSLRALHSWIKHVDQDAKTVLYYQISNSLESIPIISPSVQICQSENEVHVPLIAYVYLGPAALSLSAQQSIPFENPVYCIEDLVHLLRRVGVMADSEEEKERARVTEATKKTIRLGIRGSPNEGASKRKRKPSSKEETVLRVPQEAFREPVQDESLPSSEFRFPPLRTESQAPVVRTLRDKLNDMASPKRKRIARAPTPGVTLSPPPLEATIDKPTVPKRKKFIRAPTPGVSVSPEPPVDHPAASEPAVFTPLWAHYFPATLFVRGTDLASERLMSCFEAHKPVRLEWIDGTSCNVVFTNHLSALTAMHALSTPWVVVKNTISTDAAGVEVDSHAVEDVLLSGAPMLMSVPSPDDTWRVLKADIPSSERMFLRYARIIDKVPSELHRTVTFVARTLGVDTEEVLDSPTFEVPDSSTHKVLDSPTQECREVEEVFDSPIREILGSPTHEVLDPPTRDVLDSQVPDTSKKRAAGAGKSFKKQKWTTPGHPRAELRVDQ